MTEVWECCGCGAEAPNLIKSCDCATMCAGLSGTERHAWMTEPCGDAEYGPDVTLGEIERHWQGVATAFKRERDEARTALGRVIQERDHLLRGWVLSPAEKAEQAKRCSCRGSDDYCTCQNVPDSMARHRADVRSSMLPKRAS